MCFIKRLIRLRVFTSLNSVCTLTIRLSERPFLGFYLCLTRSVWTNCKITEQYKAAFQLYIYFEICRVFKTFLGRHLIQDTLAPLNSAQNLLFFENLRAFREFTTERLELPRWIRMHTRICFRRNAVTCRASYPGIQQYNIIATDQNFENNQNNFYFFLMSPKCMRRTCSVRVGSSFWSLILRIQCTKAAKVTKTSRKRVLKRILPVIATTVRHVLSNFSKHTIYYNRYQGPALFLVSLHSKNPIHTCRTDNICSLLTNTTHMYNRE